MKVPIEKVEHLLAAAAGRFVSTGEAETFAKLCMDTHLRKFPRMNPLQEAVSDIQAWQSSSAENKNGPDLIIEKPGIILYDFNQLPPSLKIEEIQSNLEKKARKNGIAAAGIVNSAGIITLNMWATGLARRDLIGIAVFNGGTGCCVPHGARTGVLGTNPMAYAIPTETDPMVMDMATTQIPFFDVKNAKEAGTVLPEGAALDQQGRPTTDASQALNDEGIANLLPMGGGFKGYGLMMLVEVLTGSLIRSLLSTAQQQGWNPSEYGCFIIAIDIDSFTDNHQFKREVEQMCTDIRDLPPALEGQPVSVPGDRGHAAVKKALKIGKIHVDPPLFETLTKLAGGESCN